MNINLDIWDREELYMASVNPVLVDKEVLRRLYAVAHAAWDFCHEPGIEDTYEVSWALSQLESE